MRKVRRSPRSSWQRVRNSPRSSTRRQSKQAAILHAEAEKEKRIREAEGQAEAIIKIQQANADGIRMIKEAGADEAVIKLKSLEAFEKAADGRATKIIVPSEIQGLAGLVSSIKEVAVDPKPDVKAAPKLEK